jgi:Winged helix-turn helix
VPPLFAGCYWVVEGASIVDVSSTFGVSRPTFYQAQTAFERGGLTGLLPKKRGPKEGYKLSGEVIERLNRATRSDLERLQGLKIAGRDGRAVSLGDLVHSENVVEDKSIYHKNLLPVTYVTADIAGEIESPVYAVLKLGPEIDKIKIPEGYVIEQIS